MGLIDADACGAGQEGLVLDEFVEVECLLRGEHGVCYKSAMVEFVLEGGFLQEFGEDVLVFFLAAYLDDVESGGGFGGLGCAEENFRVG